MFRYLAKRIDINSGVTLSEVAFRTKEEAIANLKGFSGIVLDLWSNQGKLSKRIIYSTSGA